MWKGVFKLRLGKASLFQASSKMWNAVFISARHSKSAPSTLVSLRFTAPTQMNLVSATQMNLVSATQMNLVSATQMNLVSATQMKLVSATQMNLVRVYMTAMDSTKGKIQSQITIPGDAKIPMEEKLLKLLKKLFVLEEELGKLEAMEAEHLKTRGCGHEYERKKMELLTRVEPLYNKAKSYELRAQSVWESFLISVFLPRFEFLLKKRFNLNEVDSTSTLCHLYRSLCDKFLELSRIRDTYPKISQIQENLTEFWKSLSFPVEPEYFLEEDLLSERDDLVKELVPLLKSVVPEYPVDVKELAFGSLSREGKSFDVVELLSRFPGDLTRNSGDRVALNLDTFKGKHVLICCFHVPYLFTDGSSDIQTLINLCDELYSTRDDFEMVMVARMNSLANYREVFDHFFSGFPGLCLAVPFEDNQRRDYICNAIGLDCDHDIFQFLLLNAEGQVLPCSTIKCPVYLYYGAEGFPFSEDILYKRDLERKDMIFEKKAWLDRVLRCNDSSPDFVYKFNPASSPREEVPISQFSNKLKNKHVGLYLCSGGEFLPDLLDMYEKCREEQLDFEVVVVYMPFAYPYDPKVFQEKIDSLLKEYDICDWWCLPFNNSVSMRFLHLTKSYEDTDGFYECDKLIMVGPKVDHLDVYGAYVIRDKGISAFPFTVDTAIKARMKEVQEITLESLFIDDEVSVFRGNNSSDSRNLCQLFQGKRKTILCIDRLLTPPFGGSDFETLASVYNQTKAMEKEDFEMVFVAAKPCIDAEEEHLKEIPCHEMPWYICPKNGTNSTKVEEFMSLVGQGPSVLVGFGEDGRVCSCQTTDEVTFDAKRKRDPILQFSLDNTLYSNLEHVMGYDDLVDHEMLFFANPEYGTTILL